MIADLISLSIPSPSRGVWHLGPLPIRAYALCIIARRRRRPSGSATSAGSRAVAAPARSATSRCGPCPAGLIGARLYHVVTDHDLYFGPGRSADRRRRDLARRPRHLGRDHRRPAGRLGRLPSPRRPAPGPARTRSPRPAAGPGDRAVRQLLQPGALRAPDHAALGAARSTRPTGRRDAASRRHRLPPDLPLRGALEPRRSRAAALARPPLPARPRARVRALRDDLHAPGAAGSSRCASTRSS